MNETRRLRLWTIPRSTIVIGDDDYFVLSAVSFEFCREGLAANRGVQYVHWVMHKCIMVKVWGKNTRKVCKKQVNLPKTGGEFVKVGGKNNFCKTGVEMY